MRAKFLELTGPLVHSNPTVMNDGTGGSYPQNDEGKLALTNRSWLAGNLSAVIGSPLAISSPVLSIITDFNVLVFLGLFSEGNL